MPLDPRPKFDVLVNDYDSAGWAKVLPPPHFPRHAQRVNEGRIDTAGVSQEAPHVLNCHGRRVNQGAFRLSPNTTGVHLYRCCHLGYPLLQGVEVRAPPPHAGSIPWREDLGTRLGRSAIPRTQDSPGSSLVRARARGSRTDWAPPPMSMQNGPTLMLETVVSFSFGHSSTTRHRMSTLAP